MGESVPGSAHGIGDFNAAQGDLIYLSPIDADVNTAGDQAFRFVGSFSGSAGEATLTYDPGADLSFLFADVNGDGIADMEITIAGQVDGSKGWVL